MGVIKLKKSNLARGIVSMMVFFLLIILDCFFDCEITKLIPSFDESVIATVTQIQVTIGTLIFTIVAIVSGNISDTYLGISITDYYLNKRCEKYSQYELIKWFIISTIICVIGYLFNLRLVVLFCFLSTLFIIYKSVKSIYEVFRGKYKIQEDIEQYIKQILEQNKNYQLSLHIFFSLSKEWSDTLDDQNFSEYLQYKLYFISFIEVLLENGNAETLNKVDNICGIKCSQFFISEKKSINKRGLILVKEIYEDLNDKIYNNKVHICSSEGGLSFFKNIGYDLRGSLEKFDYFEVQDDILKMNDLLNILIVTMMTTRQKNEKNLFKVIYSLSYYLLDYFSWLSKQNHNFNSMVVGQLYSGIFGIGNKFSENKNILNEGGSLLFFIYCKNAIDHGFYIPIFEKVSGVSKDENEIPENFTEIKNKEHATALLALECYIFGVIFHDESKFIGEKEFIEECLKSLFNNTLKCLKTNSRYIDLDVYYQTIRMINNQFWDHDEKIRLLHKDYITYFFCFILTDLALNTKDETFNQLLKILINEVKVPEKDTLRRAFEILARLFFDNDDQVRLKIDEYVNFALNKRREFYQKKCIGDIKKYNEQYEKLNHDVLIGKIEKDIKQWLTDKFNNIIVEDSKKVDLTSDIINFTVDDIDGKKMVDYYNRIVENETKEKVIRLFFEELCQLLISKGKAVESPIEKYQNNDEIIGNYHLLIGANILARLHLNKDKIQNFSQMYDVINIRFSKYNLLLPNKEFKMIIKNIVIRLTGKSIAEMNIAPDSNGRYQWNGINDGNETINYYWSEEEMKSITNYHKKIVIQVEIALSEDYKPGVVLESK